MMGDDPPFLSVGTEVSAKYKGAFCEAKIRKVVKTVKCKIQFKQGSGTFTVGDEHVKGTLRVGSNVEARHPEKKEYVEGNITKIQDCSQYTVVFDDGDITTLRRTALCLKSGRHFAESETLDQLPLTHPEHFSNPVVGGRRGRRHPRGDSSDEEDISPRPKKLREEKEADTGRVVCVEGEKKKQKDNWFPALVVAPTAQDTVRIHVREEYLVRSFKDGRYYTVPKKEITEFTREIGARVDNHTLKTAVEKALLYMDKDELPPHWDRDLLFGLNNSLSMNSDHNMESDSSDNEPPEEKDHFVAQLYKFMDDRGTPINQGPTVSSKDVDLYRLFKIVQNLGGYNRVTNYNHWKTVSNKLGFGESSNNINMVKNIYKKFLHSFEEFYRKLGCTMVSHPRTYRGRSKSGRSLIRDRDRLSVSSLTRGRPSDESEDSSMHEPPTSSVTEVKTEIKSEPEEEEDVSDIEPVFSRSRSSDLREKLPPKKVPEIKEEPKEEPKAKPETPKEDLKRDKPVRQSKLKASSQTETPKAPPKPPAKTETTPEKKKGFFKKLAGKRGKETPPVTKTSPSGLALTRKKRVVKEKVKSFVDKIKNKLVKDSSTSEKVAATPSAESTEKPSVSKPKAKEEPVNIPTKVKKEESNSASKAVEEKKKTGRKKKEKEGDEVFDTVPSYKTVSVGDKLKVYYGPTHESKVTYEAKVISIRNEGSEVTYLVHYTGWNTRYDEYIKHSRIADNLSWVPGRTVKKTNQASMKAGRKKSSTGLKTESPKVTSPAGKQGNAKLTPPPVKRSSSRMSMRKDEPNEEKVDEPPSEEKEKPTKEVKEGGPTRRRRKPSDSESENREGADVSEDSAIEEAKQQEEKKSDSDAGSEKSSPPRKGSISADDVPLDKRRSVEKEESPPQSPAENTSFSHDFDLNQIRSELISRIRSESTSADKAESEPPSPSSAQHPEEENAEEDVYEFKEPEPFEFESRKSDDKSKGQRRPRMFEDIGNASPAKKQTRTILATLFYKGKKEVEGDTKEYTESVYNFDTCEDMFDKESTSPTRESSEECSRSYPLFSDLPEGDEESTSGSVTSKPVSPSQTDATLPPDSIMDSFDSNGVESTTKSCFSRDEDDSGDESINYAIQRAIKQDMSDNEDHVDDEAATSPSLLKIDSIIYSPDKESSVDKAVSESVTIAVDEPALEIKEEESSEMTLPQEVEPEEPEEEVEEEEEVRAEEEEDEEVVAEQNNIEPLEKEEVEIIEENPTVEVIEHTVPEETVVEEEEKILEEEEEEEEEEEDIKMEDEVDEEEEERVEEEIQEETHEEIVAVEEEKKIKEDDEDEEGEEKEVMVKEEIEEEIEKQDNGSDSVPLYLKCEETIPGSPQRSKDIDQSEVIEQPCSPPPSPEPAPVPEDPDSDSSSSSSSSDPPPAPAKPSQRFSKQSRYNFLVAFEPNMDSNQRVAALMNSIQEIRKCYADLKSELAFIDRRRKKLRKRERERLLNSRVH